MVALPRPAAVICDLDGTLVDTVPTRITAWMQTFDEVGLPFDRAHLASLIGSDGRWLTEQVAARVGRVLGPGEAERVDRRAGEVYQALNASPRPLPGVPAFLGALTGRGMPWAIATSSRREQVHASVAALDLGTPPVIVDGATVARAKPEPDLLLAASVALDTAAADCWCVGDSRWDMAAADAAGMVPVGVTTGAVSADTLRTAGARAVVARLDELVGSL